MNETLKETIKLVPDQPGCYLYYDKDGEIIYVGKLKILNAVFTAISINSMTALKQLCSFHKSKSLNTLLLIQK